MFLFTKSSAGFFVAHNATVVGDVRVGADTSFWFNTVARGDVATLTVGRRVNVQDGAILHCDTGLPNTIEDDVSIGHGAIVHGTFVGRGTLVGMAAVVLSRTRVGSECLIGAGAVLAPGTDVPDRSVVMGVPGKVVRAVNDEDLKYMHWLTGRYVELAEKYVAGEVRGLNH